jgi:hypothetical protein
MIGNQKIVDSGSLSFDMSNPNTEIIASGNGLLALTRIARQSFNLKDVKQFAKIEFNQPRESRSLNIKFSYSKEGLFKKLFFAFETAITPADKFKSDQTYAHHSEVDKLIGATEDQAVEFIYGVLLSGVGDHIPTELFGGDITKLEGHLSENGYTLPEKNIIKEYLSTFKKDGVVSDSSFVEFISYVKDIYIQNVTKFIENNLGKEVAPKLAKMFNASLSIDMNNYKTFISGGEERTIAHAWNALKSIGKEKRSVMSDIDEDEKTYRIGESKRSK